ncbi:MAG: S8 family serine peptidase [Bacteroidales bacterium]
MKIQFTALLAILITINSFGQVAPDKYWVKFTDKNNSPFSIENPGAFLSQKAIDRRTNQGIEIVENDLPVNQTYITAVANTGATILNVSKWFNSVTVYTEDPSVITAINALAFVSSVQKISNSSLEQGKKSKKPFFDNETINEKPVVNTMKGTSSGQSFDYGSAYNQINMLNGIALHDLGFDGTGMTIAILDAGFTNTDILSAFDSLWLNNQILGYKDFANPLNPNIFSSHTHGTSVLSTMGANLPGEMVGTAPRANYWLLRSEDGGSEYIIEELNWASAAEFADSVGADIINSSLGYNVYDDPTQSHTWEDLDGNTAPVTIAADLAASKGILVVNSAGNEGNNSWQYVNTPADGDSVFSIGAVTGAGNYASFSSIGPTYDGRIRPNVVAQGSGSTIISAYSGDVVTGSGTSFSSPITAGMVACLWQAHPDKNNTEIMAAIEESGSLADNPTMLLGYGIPDYFAAHTLLSIPVIHEISLDIRLFLEGPFNGIDMDAGMNAILPLDQPYNVPPFNYAGGEHISMVPGPDIVDWILVELRDATSPSAAGESTIIEQRAAFLKSDGSIVDTSGLNPVSFTVLISDSIFLAIHHRNHLGILSSVALKNSVGNVYAYDFTTGASKVYGATLGYKDIGSGVFGLVSGDGNADGFINQSDKDLAWEEEAGKMEYHSADYNCDAQIDNVDKDDFWLPNQSFISQIPQ